jgi:arginine N-succinyltransferase
MYLIRQATIDDAATLLKLAKMVHFINLPADQDIIHRKIARSRQSFASQAPSEREREFMFVLQDTETGNVIGTSSVICCLSWPGRPHTYLQVRERRMFSDDLRSGSLHTTLQLGTDETGPSEIGGLILSPAYRGKKEKLGSLLSLVRFHFIGLNREWFSDRIIAEMMAPLTPDSRNTLWEYLGRRFINLSYAEADRFCQYSKEFITSLFPKDEIHVSLLPPEARNLIGRVGKETEPAKAMLERLGFRYMGHVDPFDGGPYLEAKVDEIPLVRNTRRTVLAGEAKAYPNEGMVSMMGEAIFRALRTNYAEVPGGVAIRPEDAEVLGVEPGDEVGLTPLAGHEPPQTVVEEKKVSVA